jgi:hypothetical protein
VRRNLKVVTRAPCLHGAHLVWGRARGRVGAGVRVGVRVRVRVKIRVGVRVGVRFIGLGV